MWRGKEFHGNLKIIDKWYTRLRENGEELQPLDIEKTLGNNSQEYSHHVLRAWRLESLWVLNFAAWLCRHRCRPGTIKFPVNSLQMRKRRLIGLVSTPKREGKTTPW
jgi:hypothetical protein